MVSYLDTCTGNSRQSFISQTNQQSSTKFLRNQFACSIVHFNLILTWFSSCLSFSSNFSVPISSFLSICSSICTFSLVPFLSTTFKSSPIVRHDDLINNHVRTVFLNLQRTSPTHLAVVAPQKMIFVASFIVTCFFLATASAVAVPEKVY